MAEGTKPFLTSIPGLIRKESKLKKVNLAEAQKFNSAASSSPITAKQFSNFSGLSVLLEVILDIIEKEKIASMFFEYSTLCSTLDSDTLSSFLCLWQREKILEPKTLASDLEVIISKLLEAKLSVYYLPNFFIRPDKANATITRLPSFKEELDFKKIQREFEDFNNKYKTILDSQIKRKEKQLINVDDRTYVQNLSLTGVNYDGVIKQSDEFDEIKVLPAHLLLHELYDKKLLKRNHNNDRNTILISIPLLGAPMLNTEEGVFSGQGALFLYIIPKLGIEIPDKIFQELVPELSIVNKDLTYNYLFEVGYKHAEKAKKSAIRSAISQVMNRQMSHNINSHVMANLVNLAPENYSIDNIVSFLHYLQYRIEFIADIITTEPLVTFPLNFSNDIIKHFFGDIGDIKEWPFYIIQYISGSNKVTYHKVEESLQNIEILTDKVLDNLIVAIPNDILGAQAFYVILENVIRNSVKHGSLEKKESNGKKYKKLELKITKSDEFDNPDYYKIVIWDNLGIANEIQRRKSDWGEEKNLTFDGWLNSKIDRTVLDNSGKLRQNDWGLLEMKICAAYLRKYSLEDIDYKPSLENIERNPEERLFNIVLDKDFNLGYELYLLKPKLACVVMRDKIPSEINVENLKKDGIHVVNVDELDDLDRLLEYGDLKLRNKKKHAVSHPYLILERGILNGKQVLSNQIFFELPRNKIKSLLSSDDIETSILNELSKEKVKEIKCLDDYECIPGIELNEKGYKIASEINDKIIIHRHGENNLKKFLNTSGNKEEISKRLKELYYYEPYSTQSGLNHLVESNSDLCTNKDVKLIHELNLAASLKVGIVDERIQAEVCKNSGLDRVILESMMVFIPDVKEFDLNANDYKPNDEEVHEAVAVKATNWLSNQKKICDYIIIHQGVIEKIMGSTELEQIELFLENFYQSENSIKPKAELIIISGRGKPSNLPKDVFYLPFSLVNQYVKTYRSKIYLYKLLKSARRYHV